MIDPQTVALPTAHRAVWEGRCAALGVDLFRTPTSSRPRPTAPRRGRRARYRYGRLARTLAAYADWLSDRLFA